MYIVSIVHISTQTACTQCSSGKYLGTQGNDAERDCQECPVNSGNNNAGSTDIASCRCNPGSFGVDGGSSCTLCPKGTYQSRSGSTACDKCVSGKYLDTLGNDAENNCLTCPSDSGNNREASTTEADCKCKAGAFGVNGGPTCNPCLQGTYQPARGQTNCATCSSGKYLDTVGNDEEQDCKACPANSGNNIAGSALETSCKCNRGAFGAHGGPACALCPQGGYQANSGQSTCNKCLSGKYLDGIGNDEERDCKACPINSGNNVAGSTLETSCKCNRGAFGVNGGPACALCLQGTYQANTEQTECTKCLSGKYLDTTGNDEEHDCEACPANSGNNIAGITTLTSCQCDPGSTGLDGKDCVPCIAGSVVKFISRLV